MGHAQPKKKKKSDKLDQAALPNFLFSMSPSSHTSAIDNIVFAHLSMHGFPASPSFGKVSAVN